MAGRAPRKAGCRLLQAGGKNSGPCWEGCGPDGAWGHPVPAQSAKAAHVAQQTARFRQAAKQAGSAAKKAAAKAGNALRAIYAAAKSLIAAAAAGGSVVLALLVLICVVGLLIASPFGILFANEPADSTSVALSTAIARSMRNTLVSWRNCRPGTTTRLS